MTIAAPLYQEFLRPQYHFTAQKNWLNDPNGLVYYKGTYHLFYQYNAKGMKWGPNSWGHATSPDLVHWKQIDDALDPDNAFGWIWSGSAVVDSKNTSGLKSGPEDVLVAIYTAGNTHADPKPVCQCIAFSTDAGKTWTKYKGNPVIKHIVVENRDPKVIWHELSQKWVMALYLDKNMFALFNSPDLIHWNHLQDVEIPGTTECPDFFELPVVGKAGQSKWIFWTADGAYMLGSSDGKQFKPESHLIWSEHGLNGYAAQTWSDIPASDGRRIQISWMRGGKYPYMPFNQQMSFPVELTLESFPEGLRICRKPIKEIDLLYDKTFTSNEITLKAGKSFVPDVQGSSFHIQVVFEPGIADAIGLTIQGTDLRYIPSKRVLTYLGKDIPIELTNGRLKLEILVDRTSVEVFAQDGRETGSYCFIADGADAPLEFFASKSEATIESLTVDTLKSAWR